MPAFELKTWFAVEGDPATWTERFYWVGSSYGAAMTRLQVCTRYRIALLGQGAFCTQLRVSDLAQWRDSVVSAPAGQQAPANCCLPSSGLLVRLQGVYGTPPQGFYRTLLLRCFPVDWLPPSPGSPNPTNPAALTALAAWQQALRANGLCIQATDHSQPLYPVTGVAWFGVTNSDCLATPLDPSDDSLTANYVGIALGNGGLIPATDPITGAGSQVGIHGVRFGGTASRRVPQLNGTRVLVSSEPGLVVVQAQLPTDGDYVSGGKCQLSTHAYVPILDVVPRGAAEKKVGHQRVPQLLGRPQPVPATNPRFRVRPGGTYGYTVKISLGPGPYPGSILLENARDLAGLVFEGYSDTVPTTTLPIAIYQILNTDGWYLVCCSGTEKKWDFATGIPADIDASIGLPWGFPASIVAAVRKTVPKGAIILVAGHSLGAMALQNSLLTGLQPTYELGYGIFFGSPVLYPLVQSIPGSFFATAADPVQYLGVTNELPRFLGTVPFVVVPAPGVPLNPAAQHNSYPFLTALEAYNIVGQKDKPLPTMYVQLLYTVYPTFP
jgi:hypothetical protein